MTQTKPCQYCQKNLEVPDEQFEHYFCLACAHEHINELESLDPQKIYVEHSSEQLHEAIMDQIVEEEFMPLWDEHKEKLKELSKKDLALQMFASGVHATLHRFAGHDEETKE